MAQTITDIKGAKRNGNGQIELQVQSDGTLKTVVDPNDRTVPVAPSPTPSGATYVFVNDTDYQILSTDQVVGFTVNDYRTFKMPPIADFALGQSVILQSETGNNSGGGEPLTVVAHDGDSITINGDAGGVLHDKVYGRMTITKGTNNGNWYATVVSGATAA